MQAAEVHLGLQGLKEQLVFQVLSTNQAHHTITRF